MKRIKIPSSIQWLLIISIFFILLMSVMRLIEMNVFPKPALDIDHPMGKAFFLGLRYDLRVVSVAALVGFLLSLIPALHPFKKTAGKKAAFIYWGIFTFLFVFIYIAGFAYFAYLGASLNASVLEYLQEDASFGMVMETYPVFWILFTLIVGTFLLHWFIRLSYRWVKRRWEAAGNQKFQVEKPFRISTGIAFFLLLAFFIFGRLGQYPLRWSDAFTLGSDYASNMALNPFQSFFSTLQHSNVSFDKEAVRKNYPKMVDFLDIKHPDQNTLNYERVITPDTPALQPPNVVVVICESFSYVKSSMSGNTLNPTPYFDSLSKQGLFFTRCFSPSVGTARGVWAVVTGIPDVERNSTSSRNPGAVNQHTIIKAFKNYDKSYYIGGSLSWANIRGLLENNIPGLKTIEQPDYDAPKINVWGVSDKHIFARANEDFSKKKGPFFSVIQTADNHRPYTIPDEDKDSFKLVNVPEKEILANGFTSLAELNAFRYTDYCYRHFIEAAKKEPYFKNTIFVFVGDHGTKGDASKYYPDAWTNGSLVNMHVPLLFYAPALIKPEQINSYASQVDVLPTAAGLARIPYKNTTMGRDLMSPHMRENPDHNGVFIYDPSNITIGLMQDSLYYFYDVDRQQKPKVFNMFNNRPVHVTDSIKNQYESMINALYQTDKYMILNNKVH